MYAPGDYDLADMLPPGTHVIQCERAASGHLMMPVDSYEGLDNEEKHGGLEIDKELVLTASSTPKLRRRKLRRHRGISPTVDWSDPVAMAEEAWTPQKEVEHHLAEIKALQHEIARAEFSSSTQPGLPASPTKVLNNI